MAPLRALVIAVALAGCGRLEFDSVGSGTDAHPSDAAAIDARLCTGPWQLATLIAELSSPQDELGAEISGDGLTLYFGSSRGGTLDIYVATRASRTAAFDPPMEITELTTASYDHNASVTSDGLLMIFASDRDGGKRCLFETTRATKGASWRTPPTRLDGLCPNSDEADGPYLTPDGLTLFYTVDHRPGIEVLLATRATRSDSFGPGVQIPTLTALGDHGFPALSGDGLTLYFETDAVLDLWQTTRPSLADPFGPPAKLDSVVVNASDEQDVSITADDQELVFSSTRSGGNQLYLAQRACP